jgi:hypothetical protein
MKSPSINPSNLERILHEDEISALLVTTHCRLFANGHDGVEMKSEVVSQNREWGYIFRYDLVNLINNENDTHLYFKDMKEIVQISTRLLVISSNGLKVTRSFTIPMTEQSLQEQQ